MMGDFLVAVGKLPGDFQVSPYVCKADFYASLHLIMKKTLESLFIVI